MFDFPLKKVTKYDWGKCLGLSFIQATALALSDLVKFGSLSYILCGIQSLILGTMRLFNERFLKNCRPLQGFLIYVFFLRIYVFLDEVIIYH